MQLDRNADRSYEVKLIIHGKSRTYVCTVYYNVGYTKTYCEGQQRLHNFFRVSSLLHPLKTYFKPCPFTDVRKNRELSIYVSVIWNIFTNL